MLQKLHKDGVKILLLLFLVLLQPLLAQLPPALFVKGKKGAATPLRVDQVTVNIFLVGDGIATLGANQATKGKRPVRIFRAAPSAEHEALAWMALG